MTVEYDDLFFYAPSFLYWERDLGAPPLLEGKAIGTARELDLVLFDKDQTVDAFLRPQEFSKKRRSGSAVGRRRLKAIKARVYDELLAAVMRNDKGFSSQREFQREAQRIMRTAWKEVFSAGVRASGIPGRGRGRSGVDFSSGDEKWLKSAMQHEMRFLNGFVNAVADQEYTMPLARRTQMYVDALDSFYDSARVIGMPANAVYRWTGRRDRRVCRSCEYLKENNPYHKQTLPTTPRSGLTICLTNCRDRLLVRMEGADKALSVIQQSKYTREQHIKNLRRIKREGQRRSVRETCC